MYRKQARTTGATRATLALIAFLPALLLVPLAARASEAAEAESEQLAGTQFVACTDQAWKEYNNCLMNADRRWEKTLCDIAFDADVVYCGAVYARRIRTGM